MKNITLILICSVAIVSCDRLKQDDSSKIQIQLPAMKAASTSSAMTAGSSAVGEPTGFSGDRPFNCYVVAVGGPEQNLSRNVCQRKDGTAVFTPRHIGPWVGAAPAGSAIAIDVPSGADRVMYVFGFYAADMQYCRDFKINGFPNGNLSDPYLVGEVGKLDLKSGQVVDLPVPLTYNVSNRFDNCTGPDFPGENGGGNVVPTKLAITKDRFPYSNMHMGLCNSFDLRLVDDQGRDGTLPTGVTVSFTIDTPALAPLPVYNSISDCNGVSNGSSTITIPAGERQRQLIFAPPASGTSFIVTASSPAFTTSATKTIALRMSGATGDELVGPLQLLPDMCYPFKVIHRNIDESATPSSGTLAYNSTGAFKFYTSAANCASNSLPGSISFSGTSEISLYGKISGASGDVTLNLQSTGSTPMISDVTIRAGSGSTNIAYIEIRGDNQVSASSCSGHPYNIGLFNEQHTPVVAPTDYIFNYGPSFTFGPTNTTCSGVTTDTISSGQHMVQAYAKPATAPTPTPALMQMSVTGPNLLGPAVYNINVGP